MAFVGNDLQSFFNRQAPLYFNAIAQKVQDNIIYGNASYTGKALLTYVSQSQTMTCLQTTASAAGCTSMYAIRFSPVENMDGAAFVVDPLTNGGLFTVNNDWTQPIQIAGSTGPFRGYAMHFGFNGQLLLPGSNNVSAITGIKTGAIPTEQQVDEMLDKVRADQNTIIVCNLSGKGILNRLGKSGALQMAANQFGYNNQIAT